MGRKNNGPSRKVERQVYPGPEHRFSAAKIGLTYKDAEADPAPMIKAPAGSPNVVVVLLDDAGFGLPSAFGGLMRTPTVERLARQGLYDIRNDFSQAEDLAAKYPEKLRELQDLFLIEAARHDVLPLDDRFVERQNIALRPNFFTGRRELELHRGMVRIPEGSGPKTSNVDLTLTVRATIPESGAEGVIACMGGDTSGWSLFVDGDRLRYHYNWHDTERYDVIASESLPRGQVELRMEVRCDEPLTPGAPATVRLFHGEKLVGEGRIAQQVRGRFGECLDVGQDSLSPVYPGYRDRLPFVLTGELERVHLSLGLVAEVSVEEQLEEQLHFD